MRRICYVVAMSLDGYIAGPKGEYDWIIMDPDIDFGALWRQFDNRFFGTERTRSKVEISPQRQQGFFLTLRASRAG